MLTFDLRFYIISLYTEPVEYFPLFSSWVWLFILVYCCSYLFRYFFFWNAKSRPRSTLLNAIISNVKLWPIQRNLTSLGAKQNQIEPTHDHSSAKKISSFVCVRSLYLWSTSNHLNKHFHFPFNHIFFSLCLCWILEIKKFSTCILIYLHLCSCPFRFSPLHIDSFIWKGIFTFPVKMKMKCLLRCLLHCDRAFIISGMQFYEGEKTIFNLA